MDSEIFAKFPFLKATRDFVSDSKADLDELFTSSNYETARRRGIERIFDALERSEVSYVPTVRASDYDRLMEALSYPYARMIVSVIGDRFLTKRYALSEAVRMNNLLRDESPEIIVQVSQELDVKPIVDDDGLIRMKFSDYLHLSSRMKSQDWKLINNDLRAGTVLLGRDKFSRLMQNALQDRIEAELPLQPPAEYRQSLEPAVNMVNLKLAEVKTKFSPTGGMAINMDFFPPCIKHILSMSRAGMNLPHSARFSLVTFLHALGMNSEQILGVFAESPDFDPSKSEYQIRHITGELTGTDGYSPPECKTMKTNGLCVEPDKLCDNEWMNHPLKYYRTKAGVRRENPPPKE